MYEINRSIAQRKRAQELNIFIPRMNTIVNVKGTEDHEYLDLYRKIKRVTYVPDIKIYFVL